MLRAILIAFIAVAVALPPAVGGVAQAAPESVTAQHDCCPAGEPCESHKSKDCGQTAACVLKCFNLSAGVVALPAPAPRVETSEHVGLVTETLATASEHPPLPPPRV
jgi:hypothetical protein